MSNKLTVTVDKCKAKSQLMRMAWGVLKSFLKGRAREKKEKELWGHEVQIKIYIAGQGEIWINESQIQKIEVDMEVQT
jgi:hypothetical protein